MWRLVDAKDQILGRVASRIATILQGKNKPTYLDNVFSGDPVVVINARHFSLTGRKPYTKIYVRHTSRPGSRKEIPISRMLERTPEEPLRLAVKRMLPQNKLRLVWLEHLHIYPDAEHPHEAQKPDPVPLVDLSEPVRAGRPPQLNELATWWLDEMCLVPDPILESTVEETRKEILSHGPSRRVGLASVLDADSRSIARDSPFYNAMPSDITANAVRDGNALAHYVRAADEQRAQFEHTYPVIAPPITPS